MSGTPWDDAQRTADDVRSMFNGHRRREPVTLRAVQGDVTHVRRIRWAWRGWAPLGTFLILAGEPGAGKGIWACYLLANLTRGTAPGDLEGDPRNVLWVAFEDSWEEVILPRMVAAGADVQRVHHLVIDQPGEFLDLARDQQALGALAEQHNLAAVTFEALVDHLPGVDDHKNAEVRRGLAPLVTLARERQLVAVGTTHLNKTTTGGYRHRVAGSGGYLAVARVGLLVHRHPDDPDLRVLALGKGNLGQVPDSMVFSIEGAEVVNPTEPEEIADVGVLVDPYFDSSMTVDEVLAGPKPDHGSREDEAVEFLQKFLADGPRRSSDVLKAAADHKLGEKTLRKHRDAAGAETYQEGRAWWWRLR